MKAQKNPKNKKQAKPIKPVIRVFSLLLLLVSLSCGAGAYWLYQNWIVETQNKSLKSLTQDEAQRHREISARLLDQLTKKVKTYGERPNIAQALIRENEIVLEKYKYALAQAFPEALNIRFIPENHDGLDKEAGTKILFTELDMINRALKLETVLPEAVKLGDQWAINTVTPLTDSSGKETQVAGVILISHALKPFGSALNAIDTTLGKSEIIQVFGNSRPITILSVGSSELKVDAAVVDVPKSHWKIRFTPSQALANKAKESPLLFITIVGLSFLLLAFGAWVLSKAIAKHQQKTGVSLVKAAAKVAKVKPEANVLANPMYQKTDILDVKVNEEDKDVLGLDEAHTGGSASAADIQVQPEAPPEPDTDVNEVVFRSYDIRGIVGEQLSLALCEKIGKALGSEVLDQGESWIIVGRDGRSHSPEICEQLINGIRSTGCNVVNIGLVPTPLMHFATHEMDICTSGVIVTASHNAADYNGFKVVINGHTLADDSIQQLRSRIIRSDYHQGQGEEKTHDIQAEYIDRIFSDVALAGDVKIVVDAANGATSSIAPKVFEELGCEVIPLHCEFDGRFPNHDPDPTVPANLQDLISKVKETEADLGIAFDGDGDRLVVITPSGEIIWPDRLLMLFAKDIVTRHPGADVLFDVKSTRALNSLISSYGGRPVMWKTGHAHMKAKMMETGAMVGGELSGHIFIKDRWYGFDDATYVGARLLEIMTLRDQDLDTIFESFPSMPSTPEIRIPIDEAKKFGLIKKLVSEANFGEGKLTTIDGLRVDFARSWGLVRASNTSPAITLRFEAETDEGLQEIQALFKREIGKADNTLTLNF